MLDARSALALRFDGDLTMLETDKHASVDLDLKDAYTQFSIKPGAKGRGPEVTNLTGAGVSARVEPFETTGLALSTSFLTGRTARQMTQREFSVRGSRGSLRLLLRPTRFDLDQKACRPIHWRSEGNDPDGTRRFVADVDGSMATVFLRIERFEEGPPSLKTRSAVLDFGRLDAWVRVFDLDSAMLRLADFGTGEDVSFSGRVSSVFIDRQKVEIAPDDRFHVVGALTGRWLEDGGVRLSGRADQFWRNGRLLSTTRWQRLTGELQVFLLGALGAALLVAARAAWPFVQRHGSQHLG